MKNVATQWAVRGVKLPSLVFSVALLAAWLPSGGLGQVNSGSNGSDGVFHPTTNTVVNMADHPNGVYQYSSVNIPSGVAVTFVANASNTPVYWLVQSNVVISGTVDVHGHGPTGTPYPTYPAFTIGGVGGPGGARGGDGGSSPTPGQGQGGGSVPAGAGGFGTKGKSFWGSGAGGVAYGNPSLVPLLGGSGGAGGGGWASGGGGGSGSILIIASGSIEVEGTINATGDLGFYSGGGSGGGIRLVTARLFGAGNIWTHGTDSLGYDGGGDGRVRIEAVDYSFTGQVTGVFTRSSPGAVVPVSAVLSTVVVSPSVVPADGQSPTTVTVTLLDGNALPAGGKVVRITAVEQLASGGVATLSSVAQPASPTDSNGRATATVTSAMAGTAIISVRDVTDGVVLTGQPTVRFGSALVAPATDLATAIVQLANSSSNLLTHSIGGIATEEGGYGDYFQTQMTADKRAQGVNALSTGIKGVMSLLVPGSEDLLYEVAVRVDKDVAPDVLSEILKVLAGSSTGLTQVGQAIESRNASLQAAELALKQQLSAGVPPATAGYVSAYQNDMALRAQANNEVRLILLSQRDLLADLQQNSALGHVPLLSAIFKDLNVVVTAAGTIVALDGGKAARTAMGVAEGLDMYAINQRNLNNDQQGYNSAVASLENCYYVSSLIDGNTRAAFKQIALGQVPSPVTGAIVSMDSAKTYHALSGVVGDLTTWLGQVLANTRYVHVDGAYSDVTVRNSGARAAAFYVVAFYWHTMTISDQLGINSVSIQAPMVACVVTNIEAGQSVSVRVPYFDGTSGGAPDDGSTISLNVLGGDGNGGWFAVDQGSSAIQWQESGSGLLGFGGRPAKGPVPQDGPQPDDGGSTNLFGLETPIKTFVYPDATNQVYQGQVWVVNPFAIPLGAVMAQPVPAGVTVVSSDGAVGGGWIVWTNSIATNGVVEHSFSFTLPVLPGAETNLPAPTVLFTDGTGTNSLTMTAVAAGFSGLFPVGVSGVVPGGVWGADTAAQLAVTNFTGAAQVGALALSLTDTNGSVVTNFSLSVSVGGWTAVSLSYTLPGTLAPGSYAVSGVLSMGGGSGQVFSGTYVVSAAPSRLSWGPVTGMLTNGFILRVQGTAGYGYLVQTSTNLVDWQPSQYLVLTNSSGQFIDYYVASSGRRFYRAVTASQGQ